jgi:hypothetical protein
MNVKLVQEIANAVLYEGYLLYPYRPSAVKNKQRWNFGVLYPRSYSELQAGNDCWFTQTQCLAEGSESSTVEIRVRFLQAVSRRIAKLPVHAIDAAANAETKFEFVDSLMCGSRILQSWQEAIEREVIIPALRLGDLANSHFSHPFTMPGGQDVEFVKDEAGAFAAAIVRKSEPLAGRAEIYAERCDQSHYRLTLLISNLDPTEDTRALGREEMQLKSLLSAHAVLGLDGGNFISLTDPPANAQPFVADCRNLGTWPVLVGDENSRDTMLSSPIILYDYPRIAPESAGNLFDSTEIDEILALRILTLTDDEKREMRQSDERAAEILERTESMPAEQFAKLHGTLRGLRAASEGRQ